MGVHRRQGVGGLILSKDAPRTAACPRSQFRGIPETFFVERLHGKAGRLEGFKDSPGDRLAALLTASMRRKAAMRPV
jgi:hypothetical protein